MEWLVLIIVVLVVVIFVLRGLTSNASTARFRYKRKKQFLSPAERSFYGVLEQAVADRFKLHTMVRVADVIQPDVTGDKSTWQRAFNKISSKHFDFVICDPATLEVKAAIELNDASHSAKKRQARDEFLQQACESAGFSLLFFEAKAKYSMQQVKERIDGT
ncbi:DUF2726 domain-containing protein [bacterium]|nr:DUF2726 domain-containing protein [bacterium]